MSSVQSSLFQCVYRTWFQDGSRLERWLTPSGIEYHLIESGRRV